MRRDTRHTMDLQSALLLLSLCLTGSEARGL